jgi:hypothetical protein
MLDNFHKAKGINTMEQEDLSNWKWKSNQENEIKISAKKVYLILLNSEPEIDNLNRWWSINDSLLVWKAQWVLIRHTDITLKGQTFLWRIIANGLFTNEWASKFTRSSGTCAYCQYATESIPHLFFECPFARDIWGQTTKYFGAPATNNMVTNLQDFLELLDHCLGNQAANTARTLILYETTFMLWKSRNLAKMYALAIINYTKSRKKKEKSTNDQGTGIF